MIYSFCCYVIKSVRRYRQGSIVISHLKYTAYRNKIPLKLGYRTVNARKYVRCAHTFYFMLTKCPGSGQMVLHRYYMYIPWLFPINSRFSGRFWWLGFLSVATVNLASGFSIKHLLNHTRQQCRAVLRLFVVPTFRDLFSTLRLS